MHSQDQVEYALSIGGSPQFPTPFIPQQRDLSHRKGWCTHRQAAILLGLPLATTSGAAS